MQHYFDQLKRNLELNDSFSNTVSARHAALRSAISNLVAIKETKLIGSLQRRTRIQPRPTDGFDIDVLVILGEFHGWVPAGGVTTAQALDYVTGAVEESDRYSKKDPTQDAPTVELTFADRVMVELVPAYIDMVGAGPTGVGTPPIGRGYWVPSASGLWVHADYDFDADYITRVNLACSGRLIPIIKMLKAAKRHNFPELKSFALEIIAAQIVPFMLAAAARQGSRASDTSLLRSFFAVGREMLANPLVIPGSNSPAIVLDPTNAEYLKTAFGVMVEHIDGIDRLSSESARADAWRLVFGDPFPARVLATA